MPGLWQLRLKSKKNVKCRPAFLEGHIMLAIQYLKRNISYKSWVMFLIGELFFILQTSLSFFTPLVQKELITSAMSGDSQSLNIKSLICITLAVLMSLVFIISIRFGGHAYGEAWKSISLKMFERIFGHQFFTLLDKGISWYRMMIFNQTFLIALSSVYSGFFLSLLQFIVILFIVGKWSISLVYVIVGINILYMIFLILITVFEKKYAEAYTQEDIIAGGLVQSDFDLSRTLHRFGKIEIIIKQFGKQIEYVANYSVKKKIVELLRNTSHEVLSSLTMLALIFACLASFQQGRISMGALVTVIAFIPQILMPCRSIAAVLDVEALTKPIKKRYNEIQKGYENTFPEQFSLPEFKGIYPINIKGIKFSYSSKDDLTYSNISGLSLNCQSNSSTALLGLSGEGKSTIVKLCTGEEKPDSGEVFFFNAVVSNLPVPLQNAFINLYSQETEIINDDALGNILMGKTLISNAEVVSIKQSIIEKFTDNLETLRCCTKKAAIFYELGKRQYEPLRMILGLPISSRLSVLRESQLIESLLTYYSNKEIASVLAEAEFGRRYCLQEKVDALIDITGIRHLLGRKLGEGGTAVSGGERQRISLARCLAKENWEILILDEPFTSLDAIAEAELSQVLRSYTRDKTLLLVTHKLNLVPLLTNEVILLEHGCIAAKGTHDDLKSSSVLYSALWEAFSAQSP